MEWFLDVLLLVSFLSVFVFTLVGTTVALANRSEAQNFLLAAIAHGILFLVIKSLGS